MSKSLDALNKAVTSVVKDAAGKSFTKDKLIEVIDDDIGFLRNALGFFTVLGKDSNDKLKAYLAENRGNTKLLSINLYNQIFGTIGSAAQRAMNDRFLGAFQDTLAGLIAIMEELNSNIDLLFQDKNITIYNTKISQVAVLGMIDNSRMFSQYVVNYIALFMADRSESLAMPVPAVIRSLQANTPAIAELINRVIGNKLNRTFVAAIKRYRGTGSDTGVVQGNKASTQFAKVNNDITDSDILAGARGIKLFRMFQDLWVDHMDAKLRKLRAERELLQARAQLLQLELAGIDESSSEYKKQLDIIKNYQKLIDRLDQRIAKLNED